MELNKSIAYDEGERKTWREKQKVARLSGKQYLTQKEKKLKPAKQPPVVEVSFIFTLIYTSDMWILCLKLIINYASLLFISN